MFIAAAIVAVGALVLVLIGRSQAGKAAELASTQTSTVASVKELASKIAAEIGPGSFSQIVEIKGTACAEAPLVAEFSSTPCVWYESVATREYEEEHWETDKDGHRHRRTRRGSEEVSRILREPPFAVDDGTGAIAVDPRGAKLEAEKSLSRFEPGERAVGLAVGAFTLALGAVLGGGRRTLGYRFEERCIPLGRKLYVLGEASDADGALTVRKSADKGKRFIVSIKSEEEIVAGALGAAKWLKICAAIAAAVALGLAIGGFFIPNVL
ncbi:MAG: E3 ubiquitin ligase family protein [Spirochaetaceae bacterium]|nr:E3 ubiquitin ligase family protein [Spirochaetaceae bacterium]